MSLTGVFSRMAPEALLRLQAGLRTLVESKDIRKNKTSGVRQLFVDFNFQNITVDPSRAQKARATLEQVRDDYQVNLAKLFYEGAALSKMQSTMAEAFLKARQLGLQSTGFKVPLEAYDNAAVGRAIAEEMKYLGKFLQEYKGDQLRMPFEQRLAMYGKTLDSQYHTGVVAALPKAAQIFWRLGIAEHCSDCPKLAAGSPYTKPGTGIHSLPAVPRSGHTRCLSNCRCRLEVRYGGANVSSDPGVGVAVTSIAGKPVTVASQKSPAVAVLQGNVDAIARKMAFHRQMIELTEGLEKKRHVFARKQANDKLIALLAKRKATGIPRASVNEVVAQVTTAQQAGLVPAFKNPKMLVPGTPVRILEGLDGSVGSVVARKGAQVSVRLLGGEVRTVWLNDNDNTVLWV